MWTLLAIGLAGPARAVDCPDGTGPVRSALPGALFEDGCATVGGVPHGPSEVRAVDGTLRAIGSWTSGARQGTWRFYDAAGRTAEVGDYDAGARVGVWTTLAPDGTPTATLFHGPLGGARAGQGAVDPRLRWSTGVPPALEAPTTADRPETEAAATAPAADGGAHAMAARVVAWGPLALASDARGFSGVALDDGATRFSVQPADGLRTHPVGSRRHLAAVTGSGLVVVADPDAGRVVRVRTEAGATHVAAVDQDTIWVRDGVGRLAAWSWEDGRVRWQTRRSHGDVAPIYAAGAVLGARGREVHAVDARTGAGRWQARMDSEVVALASGRDGSVLVRTRSGALERMRATNGEPLATLVDPGAAPATGDVRDEAGGVILLGRTSAGWLGGTAVEGFSTPPDLAEGLACGGGAAGGLRCRVPGAAEDRVGLPGVRPVGPVRILGELLLVPTSAGLVAVDLEVLLATTGESEVGLPVVLWPLWGGPVEARLPYSVVHREGAAADCELVDGVLDLSGAVALLPADEDGLRPPFSVEVPELEVGWHDGEPAWSFGPDWTGDLLDARWEASYTAWWRPELLAVTPLDASPAAAAALDRLLACDGPGARFRGQAIAVMGGRRLVLEGQLRLDPWPHEVDGLAGCLVDVSVDGEDLGPLRPSAASGWIDLHLAQLGGASEPIIPEDGVPLPLGIEDGEVLVETLLPGEVERVELAFTAPVDLTLEDAWPSGLDLVLRADGGAELLRLPGDDLVLSEPPAHTEWWSLRSAAPMAPEAAGPSSLWSRTDCAEALVEDAPPQDAAAAPLDDEAAPLEAPEPGAPPAR